MTRARAHHRGFTLLELLVAIGIFALFSAMAYGSLTRLLESRERVEVERLFWRELSLAFLRMQDDFSQARARKIRDTDGSELPPFLGQPTDPRALGDPNVELTRAGVTAVGDRPDLQRVAYRLTDGSLRRLYWPVLDRAPTTQPITVALLGDIDELRIRFFDQSWLDRWPPSSGSADPLPKAVEVTLVHRTRGSYTRTFLVGAG